MKVASDIKSEKDTKPGKAEPLKAAVSNSDAIETPAIDKDVSEKVESEVAETAEKNSDEQVKKSKFGFGMGFVAGIVVAVIVSAYPAVLGFNFSQDTETALAASLAENTQLKIQAAKDQIAVIDKTLLEIEQASEAHAALLAKVPELQSDKAALEDEIAGYISEEAAQELEKDQVFSLQGIVDSFGN